VIAAAGTRAPARARRIQPRARRRESGLLALVAMVLVLGSVSLGATQRQLAGQPASWLPADVGQLLVYLGALLLAHLALVVAGRRSDQILLPTIGLLGGLSLLLMERLPQSLVTQSLAGRNFGLASIQLGWLLLAIAVITGTAVMVRSDAWLRRYKYTWAAAGIVLLLLTFLFGNEVNGALLTIQVGPFSGQPTELIKVILVIFLAGYLSDFRPLLVSASMRLGPLRLPPVPYLLPMLAMWAMALGIVVIQRDLGAALLFFAVFLALVYIATARASYVVLGLLMFVAGSLIAYQLFGTVRDRVDIWINPFIDASGKGYQVVQALYAFGRGGILGTGLGAGLPLVAGRLPIPAIHTDFPLAALGEELGLLGVVAILGLYLVVIERGLRVAASAADDFRALLAAGLTLVVGVQAFIIAGGNLKLIPLTGVTLPFISYGGSSLLANGVVVGLLLALSDRGVEAPPPPRPARSRRPAFLGGPGRGVR
jgi:cell division protein FtsW (lipid II flippase)